EGYPISVCSQSEMQIWPPYITKLTMAMAIVPRAKESFPNTRRSATGCCVPNSRTIQATSPTTNATAKTTMNLESNQSCSCPLSNMIWSAATQITSVTKPQESTADDERRMYGGSFRKALIIKTESKPTGRLM